jgi:hypothetical protein
VDGDGFDGTVTQSAIFAMKSFWLDPAVQHIYPTVQSSYFIQHHIGGMTIDRYVKLNINK